MADEPPVGGPDPFDFSARALGGELELASAGFTGAPVPFPHREVIERSFGRALPATAYSDAAAARACAALGAEGYALGDRVAFATETPSLELAAHEAAHVLQASHGVELFGGDSAYEAHADEVAARVVRGESAAELLGGAPAAAAVRRQTRGAQSTSSSGTTGSTEQPAAAAPTGRTRMAAAIAARDVPAIVTLFRELVPVAREAAPAPVRQGSSRGARRGRGAQPGPAQPGQGAQPGQPGQGAQPGPAAQPDSAEVARTDAREAITSGRHFLMQQIADLRDRHASELAAAARGSSPTQGTPGQGTPSQGTPSQGTPSQGTQSQGTPGTPGQGTQSTPSQGTGASPQAQAASAPHGRQRAAAPALPDHTPEVEAVEERMDAECTPYLDALLAGDPENRYQHPNSQVQSKVFEAVRLHAMRRGVGRIGHRVEAEAEARDRGGVREEAWCGAFAFTQAEQGGGFDRRWAENMAGESGIRSALDYGGNMPRTWIWAEGRWQRLRAYHQARGSERWYERVTTRPPSRGVQAGDLVLIDNAFGGNPDHITTAIAFDGDVITTVGGNQGSGENGVSRSRFRLSTNPPENDVRRVVDGVPVREARPDAHKNVRVHGIGRWSVVDYERHLYRIADREPTEPPTAEERARTHGR